MKPRILVLAADIGLRASLARWLLAAGYGVELAESLKRAREVAAGEDIPLAIVEADGLAPGGSDLVSDLANSIGRIVLIGGPPADAAGQTLSSVTDGWIAKPPEEQEVLARVEAALQVPASREESGEPQFLRVAQLTIDMWGRECRDGEGELVPLTRAEFSLLAALARTPGRVLSRDELRKALGARGADRDDRSTDVLISRLRRKIEKDPKDPRLIVTVPGEGYKVVANPPPTVIDAPPPTSTLGSAQEHLSPPSAPSTSASGLVAFRGAALIGLGAAALAAVLFLGTLFWYPDMFRKGIESVESHEKFDAASVPLIRDSVRTMLASYPGEPDAKAVALSADGYGVASAASDLDTAKREALQACTARARLSKFCRIYAAGMDVLWNKQLSPWPESIDFRSDLLNERLVAADIPFVGDVQHREIDERQVKGRDHRAFAIAKRGFWGDSGYSSRDEIIRLVVERCGYFNRKPCLLLSVDGFLTVQIPKSRRIVDIFMVAAATDISDSDKARIAEVYREKDWRALARGKSGSWYPIARERSEEAAVQAALKSCAQRDSDCKIFAISNFRVEDAVGGSEHLGLGDGQSHDSSPSGDPSRISSQPETGLKERAKQKANLRKCLETSYFEDKRDACTLVISDTSKTPEDLALAYHHRGTAYLDKGDNDRAIPDFDAAIKLNPAFANPLNNRGIAYYNKGQFDRAMEDYDAAIRMDPGLAQAYNNRGNIFLRRGDNDRALADFQDALRLKPDWPLALAHRGQTFWSMGNREQALRDYDEAIRVNPRHAVALTRRGLALYSMGEDKRAITDFEAAVRVNGKAALALYGRGIIKRRLGDPRGGEEDIAAAEAMKADIAEDFVRASGDGPPPSRGSP